MARGAFLGRRPAYDGCRGLTPVVTFADPDASRFLRPAAPLPRPKRPSLFSALRLLRANPIDAFSEQAYDAGIMDITRGRNRVVLVNEPAAIERILVDNAQPTPRASSSSAGSDPLSAPAF